MDSSAIASRAADPLLSGLPTPAERPDSPEDAAKAFEKVLVRRLVKTMTKQMFDSPLSGADGPSWMNGQRDQQRDVLTDVLADHIVASDSLRLRDMLLRDWGIDPDAPDTSPNESADPASTAPPAPLDARPTVAPALPTRLLTIS